MECTFLCKLLPMSPMNIPGCLPTSDQRHIALCLLPRLSADRLSLVDQGIDSHCRYLKQSETFPPPNKQKSSENFFSSINYIFINSVTQNSPRPSMWHWFHS